MIEKKTQAALTATQDKNRIANELSELRDQVDIKDRKVNVLQRKVITTSSHRKRERETENVTSERSVCENGPDMVVRWILSLSLSPSLGSARHQNVEKLFASHHQ